MLGEKLIKSQKKLNKFSFDIRSYMMLIALMGIWIIFTVLTKGIFLVPRNLTNLFRQSVFTGILAIGMVNVIVLGQIDLSVGSITGLCGGILAILNVWKNFSPISSIIITLLFGLLMGLWNGWWISYKNVPSFIATLAGLLVFRGILVGVTSGITIGPLSPSFSLIGKDFLPNTIGIILGVVVISIYTLLKRNESFREKSRFRTHSNSNWILKSIVFSVLIIIFVLTMNDYNGIPNPVIILVFLFIIFNFMSNRTVFGRRVYAIGGNKIASILSGINVKKITLIIFALNGLLAAIAGIYLTSRLNSAAVNAGTSAELDAIAACVIGGASLMGGTGTVLGAIIGAVVMASLDNGMSLLNAPSFYQIIVKGLVLLVAVWFDMSLSHKL